MPQPPPPTAPLPALPPQAANAAVAPQGGQAIWKTTTYDQAHGVQRDRDEVSVAQARAHGWRLMDAWALTREAALCLEPPPFVDNVHFYGCAGLEGVGGGWGVKCGMRLLHQAHRLPAGNAL